MVESNVLTFGDFITKSGRKTPFFINTGNYKTGLQIARLGEFYAQAIQSNIGNDFDVLYGPAYKGIPLVVATAIALATNHGHNVPYCFNRKEAKDHGEGGSIVGHKPANGQRIVIVDDVTTAGTSAREIGRNPSKRRTRRLQRTCRIGRPHGKRGDRQGCSRRDPGIVRHEDFRHRNARGHYRAFT